jgi:hypothetical protein
MLSLTRTFNTWRTRNASIVLQVKTAIPTDEYVDVQQVKRDKGGASTGASSAGAIVVGAIVTCIQDFSVEQGPSVPQLHLARIHGHHASCCVYHTPSSTAMSGSCAV